MVPLSIGNACYELNSYISLLFHLCTLIEHEAKLNMVVMCFFPVLHEGMFCSFFFFNDLTDIKCKLFQIQKRGFQISSLCTASVTLTESGVVL